LKTTPTAEKTFRTWPSQTGQIAIGSSENDCTASNR